MAPMSRFKRKLYFYIFSLGFLLAIPVLILYANGYRFTKDWKLAGSGGIYIYAPQSNSDIFLNGEKVQQSGLFQRGVLLEGLKAGQYDVRVSKDTFSSWQKQIEVKDGFVSEGYPFAISASSTPVSVPEFATTSASTVVKVKNPEYTAAALLFQPTVVKKPVATSTPLYDENALHAGNLVVSENGTVVIAEWLGDTNSMPHYFCNAVLCTADTKATSTIYMNAVPKSHIDFLPGRTDVILLSSATGIQAVELDTRPTQNVVNIYQSKKADFRVSDNVVYIKEGALISKIEL